MAFEQNIEAADKIAADADIAAAIGNDERRMHVRAYNYWCSLLDGRDFPSIEDLDPSSLDDFGPHSVLLDFTGDSDDPATPYVGEAIREECGLDRHIRRISDVPSRSLLSRLTDHYMQIIANRAPVGFEAEFVNQRGHEICYRGILMPLSSDGDTIDFIYGVINWKDAGEQVAADAPLKAVLPPLDQTDAGEGHLAWEDGPLAEEEALPARFDEAEAASLLLPDPDAGLADWLVAARDGAERCKAAEGRSRAALYAALGLAYDFSIAAEADPEEYRQLLADAGVKVQKRAPMTPIVKLVFGADYDKRRLTEYATALAYGHRSGVEAGDFEAALAAHEGGLKGMVKAERAARRGARPAVDKAAAARKLLREATPIGLEAVEGDAEFSLVVTRRNDDGSVVAVARIDDPKLVDRALVKAAS